MIDTIDSLIDALLGSSWALAIIVLICALDAFFPVVPSETAVIGAAVLAAAGQQNLGWVIALAATGAFVGDHVTYFIGRQLGDHVIGRLLQGRRGRAARSRAEHALQTRGGLAIVALRFIPGGRTATTLTAGALRYRLTRFSAFDALAALLWATYAALIGYWAGQLFAGNALLGVVMGVGISVAITGVVEAVRFLAQRLRRHRDLTAAGARRGKANNVRAP